MFDSERGQDEEIKTIKLDPTKTIAAVSMKFDRNHTPCGIKIHSDAFEELCAVQFDDNNSPDATWKSFQIPKGQQICGLTARTKEDGIRKLGFILGTCASVIS